MTAPSAASRGPGAVHLADAMTAAALVAAYPARLGGLVLKDAAGPVADMIQDVLTAGFGPERPRRRLPVSIDTGRLDGGLDVAATLAAGRPVVAPGLLAEVAGGLLVVPGAERLPQGTAARIAAALDDAAGPAVLAFDDGAGDDPPPPTSLGDRLAFHVALDAVRLADLAFAEAAFDPDVQPIDPATVAIDDAALTALAMAAEALGVPSARVLMLAAAAAQAAAALDGRTDVSAEDLAAAARLVLGPRATRMPVALDEPPPPEPDQPDDGTAPDATDDLGDRPLADVVLAAAAARLPAHLLDQLGGSAARRASGDGRGGPDRTSATGGGRPLRSRPGRLGRGARIDLVETLRAAAPMQRLRGAPPAGAFIAVRAADIRVRRWRRPTRTTTVFVVDASGSSAIARLAEAKGAVELVLADCYVRRDRVALIAFRGRGADLVLPPTSSLTAARRRLADLAAGGGTPLAAGLDAAAALAARVADDDGSVAILLLTDGQANVARDGTGGRARAEAEALDAAGRIRAACLPVLLVDIADRPSARAAKLADALAATYLPLPRADAGRMAAAARIGARRAAAHR